MKKTKRLFNVIIAFIVSVSMVIPIVSVQAAAKPKVKISTNVSASNKMYMGTNKALNVKTSTASNVTFKTSNSSIAAVKSGKLYAYKPGSVTVKVSAKPKSSKYQTGTVSFKVNVLPQKPITPTVLNAVTRINASTNGVKGADGYQFMYATNSNFSGYKSISTRYTFCNFSLSKGKTYYVKVRSYAVVNGKKYYSGWSNVGKLKSNSSSSNKPSEIPVDYIAIGDRFMNVQMEDGPFTMEARVSPSNATNKTITWTSSDTSVAVVDSNGRVTPLKEGKTRITAKAGTHSDYCDVYVMSIDYMVKRVIELINIEREKVGAPPLKSHPLVQKGAMVRAKELETKFSHYRPNGTDGSTALAEAGAGHANGSENIAYGQTTPEEVVSDWMNSTGHRIPMISDLNTHVGVGVHLGKNDCWYWSLNFTDGNPDDKVTITFDTVGGSYLSSLIIPYGGEVDVNDLPSPTKPGYTFAGWYKYPDYSYKFPGIQELERNLTLYAKWE